MATYPFPTGNPTYDVAALAAWQTYSNTVSSSQMSLASGSITPQQHAANVDAAEKAYAASILAAANGPTGSDAGVGAVTDPAIATLDTILLNDPTLPV